MSRGFRLRVPAGVQDTHRRPRVVVRDEMNRPVDVADEVSTCLEILEVLPREQMRDLLVEELCGRGFEPEGDKLVRREAGGLTVTVDPATGEVTVRAEVTVQAAVAGERSEVVAEAQGQSQAAVAERLREELRRELETRLEQAAAEAQGQAADRLEGRLGALRQELDQAVNKVTGEALKQKAGRMGTIKELTEDPESGNLTIVVEV